MKTCIVKYRINLMLVLLAMVLMVPANAQEYKLPKSTGKLELKELNAVIVEGYSGNEIIFTSADGAKEKDKRAEGLRAVNNMGLEDNTGIGLAVVDKGATVEVYQLKKMDGPHIILKVPKGVIVSYVHTSPHGSGVKFRNMESEIEVSTLHSEVWLENITGPTTVKTVHGDIEAEFNSAMKGPISIASVHGAVDVTIPIASKVNIKMATEHGEIFVDPALKIEFDKQGEWTKYGSNKVEGKINGGGLDMSLSTPHGTIYLRKKMVTEGSYQKQN